MRIKSLEIRRVHAFGIDGWEVSWRRVGYGGQKLHRAVYRLLRHVFRYMWMFRRFPPKLWGE